MVVEGFLGALENIPRVLDEDHFVPGILSFESY